MRFEALLFLDDDLVFIAGFAHTVVKTDGIFVVAHVLYGPGISGGGFLRKPLETAFLHMNLALGHAGLIGLVPQAGQAEGQGELLYGRVSGL